MYRNTVVYEKNCPKKYIIKINNKNQKNNSFTNNFELIDNYGFGPNNLAGSPPNRFLDNLKKRIKNYE
jgi:hypothetical protein